MRNNAIGISGTNGKTVAHRLVAVGLSAVCLLGLSVTVSASDHLSDEELTFFNGETYREIVWIALQRAEKRLRDPACGETLTDAERLNIEVIERLVTEPDGRFPSSGVWRDQLAVTRCGVRHVHNLRFDAREQAAPKPKILVPGQSHASEQLQTETMAPLQALSYGANSAASSCDDTQVRDTTAPVGLSGGEPDFDQGWTETWTVRACGQLHQVPIIFKRNSDGSTTVLPTPPGG
ncbi:MAG: hypothetical protein AAGF58_05400 [Pseudomonadota bacterium]